MRAPIRLVSRTLVVIALLGPVSVSMAQSWVEKAPMPTERSGLATCAVNGKVYAIGGGGNSPTGVRTVEEYDPATDSWRERAPMPTGRRRLAAAAVSGRCYAIGGHRGTTYSAVATVEEYDPDTDSWRSRADMPVARMLHAAAVTEGRIFVVGGTTAEEGGNLVPDLAVYDPATDSWTMGTDIPTPRARPAASAVNGKIYVIGGVEAPNVVEEYDPATDGWTRKANMPTRREYLTASAVNGRIYAIGGRRSSTRLANVEEYDPGQDSWVAAAALSIARSGLASSVANGRIYAIGGYPGWTANEEYTPGTQVVRRCFFDAETLAPVLDVRLKPRNGPRVSLGASDCSDDVPYDFLTIDAPGYRKRETHAANGKGAKLRAALPGENGLHFGLFPEDSEFTDLVDSGRTTGNKKKRGILQGLPYMKLKIVRPADFPMTKAEIKRAAVRELRKSARFKKPSFAVGVAITREDQILLEHAPGEEPSVGCTILEDGVCWGPIVSFDAAAGDPRTALEEGLRRIFFCGKGLATDSASVKLFYRGFQASVVGQKLKRGKEIDVVPDSFF